MIFLRRVLKHALSLFQKKPEEAAAAAKEEPVEPVPVADGAAVEASAEKPEAASPASEVTTPTEAASPATTPDTKEAKKKDKVRSRSSFITAPARAAATIDRANYLEMDFIGD